MELSKEIFDEITRLSNEGNELLDVKHDAYSAYNVFESALELLPEPANEWEAFSWLQASMGECKFIEKEFNEAYEHFRQAYNALVPNVNAYILLRIGECAFELQLEHAQEFLLQAYMVAGKDIFNGEDKKYYKAIAAMVRSNSSATSKPKKNSKNKPKMEVKRLSGEAKELYEKNMEIASGYYEEKDWDNYFGMLKTCWNSIPEPQVEYAKSFELLMIYFTNACKYGYAKEMLPYVPAMKAADLARADIGDREYYIAIVYYENGMIDEAKEMFRIADKKSRGRAISDKKYKAIYKGWKRAGEV